MLFVLAGSASAHDLNACKLTLTPKVASNPVGSSHTITATVTIRGGNEYISPGAMCATAGGGGPAVGKLVHFKIISGPNSGLETTGVTDLFGHASATWSSSVAGVDVAKAWISEPACSSSLFDWQTIADCPPSHVYTSTISDTASKHWFNPYDPGGGPGDCTDNPYYYDSVYCADFTAFGKKKKAWVALTTGKKCKSKPFKLTPSYDGGLVLWSKLYVGGKKYKTMTAGPYVFKVGVKKYKKGKKYPLKLSTVFTTGEAVVLKSSFKKCGKS